MARNTIEENAPQIDLNTLKNLHAVKAIYHEDEDTFFLRPDIAKSATSFDWNGEIWLRYDLGTGEIVGLEIENFEQIFCKKYPEVGKVWKDIRPYCIHKQTRNRDDEACQSFIRILLQFFVDLFASKPIQATLPIS